MSGAQQAAGQLSDAEFEKRLEDEFFRFFAEQEMVDEIFKELGEE